MTDAIGHPILILGMHRSGTSYLARLMQSLGVFIGDDLVGPQKGNPRGHFEAVPMLEFHQKLIGARIGGSRRAFDDGMLVQKPLDSGYTDEEKAEAGKLLTALRRAGNWGWKEPRTCLFLDLWTELEPEAGAVIVYRHPLEVHQSLLRREHWDLSLFPDQAMRAYTIYNEALLEGRFPKRFLFNANAGFTNPGGLADRISKTFGLERGETPLPEFHASEFQTITVSKSLHRLTGLIYPEAVAVFDALQAQAEIVFEWQERDDDTELEETHDRLEPVVAALPQEGRAFLGPLLDGWASGEVKTIFDHYGALAEEIGGRVQRVEQWNREAAEIFKENERLSADYERMGKEYAAQQEFLAKQAKTQAKVWEELSRTGNSWKEQRAMINDLLKEKRQLLQEIEEFKDLIGKDGNQPS